MGKPSSIKRVSTISQPTSTTIDFKARKRIEELFELSDEIIDAYNEINEKYVSQIYRKYRQLQEINKNLKEKLNNHHCAGCQCTIKSNGNEEEEDESSAEEEEEEEDDDQQTNNPALPSSTTSSVTTRSKRNNPFIIPDIEETQNFDSNDSRFNKNASDDEADKVSLDTNRNPHKRKKPNESSEESADEDEEEEEVDPDNGMTSLPLGLQTIIRNKAKRNKNAKLYLLEIPRYPALCEYLRDKSRASFDHRPSDIQVRPLIENHISKNLAKDAKIRMRLRDELREIHRSYLRLYINDPHTTGAKSTTQKPKLPVKKSPM